MQYYFLDEKFKTQDITLSDSSKINHYLLKNHNFDIVKGLDFLADEGKFLYIHGFLGTGKRQVIEYLTSFISKDAIILKYFCKPSTVCDDILLSYIDVVEKLSISKAINLTAKVTTLAVKFEKYISSIKKPFIIILESFDDVAEENQQLIKDFLNTVIKEENVKIVLSTRAMIQDVLDETKPDKKVFLRGLTKDIFKDFVRTNQISATDNGLEEFYKQSRGYYYYTALAIKIMQAMEISLNDFLSKFTMSGMSFDSFLGMTYINLIPNTIRNFFWFLCSIRHGININALAILGLYDEFSVSYLKNNLMIFQDGEILYVQDYFQQDIDISIPAKTEIRLHKYIIGIYEKELKESLQTRSILISRQALRSEIEYHTKRIQELETNKQPVTKTENIEKEKPSKPVVQPHVSGEQNNINNLMKKVKKLSEAKKYTEAIEGYKKIIDEYNPNPNSLAELRTELGRLYFEIHEYSMSQHYYELARAYYEKEGEYINLNYLEYELANLYYTMYKTDRAIETIKKVIYSVDTPQSLMVDSCIKLGNIYTDKTNLVEAYKYYIKALESVDENTTNETRSELFFKLALVCDENGESEKAFEYYNKCISINEHNSYKAAAYSNLGSCYYENENLSDAEACFLKAYGLEKNNNNYEGIYFVASYLAKIYNETHNKDKAYQYLTEAKQSAEFINEDFYVLEATLAMGDYYYDYKNMNKEAYVEYLKAQKIADGMGDSIDITKIQDRINDMKLRMNSFDIQEIEDKYGK